MKTKNKYLEILKMTLKEAFVYKSDFIINFFSSFILVLVQYFIWRAVFFHKKEIASFSFNDTITYMVVVWYIHTFFNTTHFIRNFQDEILDGSISYKLLFPINPYIYFLIKTYSENLINLLISGSLIIFFSYLIFPLKLPSPSNLFLFIFSLNLSFLISFNISFIIVLTSCFLKKIEGLVQLNLFLSSIFSGSLLPLDFFPAFIKNLSDFLPYKGIVYLPVTIFINKLNEIKIFSMIFYDFIWIFILQLIILIFLEVFYKKIEIYGG
jgi:ABC-2 type transport system permease protein